MRKPDNIPCFCLYQITTEETDSAILNEHLHRLLKSMLIAQTMTINTGQGTKDTAIFGAMVFEKINWAFITLQDKEYGISKTLSATDEDDNLTIFKALKAVRQFYSG